MPSLNVWIRVICYYFIELNYKFAFVVSSKNSHGISSLFFPIVSANKTVKSESQHDIVVLLAQVQFPGRFQTIQIRYPCASDTHALRPLLPSAGSSCRFSVKFYTTMIFFRVLAVKISVYFSVYRKKIAKTERWVKIKKFSLAENTARLSYISIECKHKSMRCYLTSRYQRKSTKELSEKETKVKVKKMFEVCGN